jgi:hypothetical protein
MENALGDSHDASLPPSGDDLEDALLDNWEHAPASQRAMVGDATVFVLSEAALERLRFLPASSDRAEPFSNEHVDLFTKSLLADLAAAVRLLLARENSEAADRLGEVARKCAPILGYRFAGASSLERITVRSPAFRWASFLLALLSPLLVNWWLTETRPWPQLMGLVAVQLLLLLVLLYLGLATGRLLDRIAWPQALATGGHLRIVLCLVFVGLCVVGVGTGAAARGSDTGLAFAVAVSFSLGCLLVLVSWWTLFALCDAAASRAWQDLEPREVVTLLLAWAAVTTHDWAAGRADQRSVLEELATLANRSRGSLLRFERSMGGRLLAGGAGDQARRLEAVVRARQQMVLHTHPRDRGKLVEAMLDDLAHVLGSDWEGFLLLEPVPRAGSWVRRKSGRAGIFVVLLVAAWLMPHAFPDLIGNPEAFRASLVVAAISALLVPDVRAAADAIGSFRP